MNFQKAAPNEDEGEEQKAAPKDEDEEGEEQKAAPNEEDNKKGKQDLSFSINLLLKYLNLSLSLSLKFLFSS